MSAWSQWVESRGWAYLKSRKSDLGSAGGHHRVLGDGLCGWLLDPGRWQAAGIAWGVAGSPDAKAFIIRSIEGRPDKEWLTDLGREGRLARPLPPPRGGLVDLHAWWILLYRGLAPLPSRRLNPRNTDDRVYGADLLTHVGTAVFCALRDRHLSARDDEDLPEVWAARCHVFEACRERLLADYYRDGWRIVPVAGGYRPSKEDGWDYLHTCMSNHLKDFLALHDPQVDLPGHLMEDRFRLYVDYAARSLPPRVAGGDDGPAPLVEWLAAPPEEPAGGPEGPRDREMERLRTALAAALAASKPVERAAFLLGRTSPGRWNRASLSRIAGQTKSSLADLESWVAARQRRIDLAGLRLDACEEKERYLRFLRDLTRRQMESTLKRQGVGDTEIRKTVSQKEDEAGSGRLKYGPLVAAQHKLEVTSPEFLAARFQELAMRVGKEQGYVSTATDAWNRREELTPDEIQGLSLILRCEAPEDISRYDQRVFERLQAEVTKIGTAPGGPEEGEEP